MLQQVLWIIITIVAIIILKKVAKNNESKTRKVIKIILIYMFVQRLILQIIKTYLQLETPYWRAIIPIHLCSLMVYILPITVCLNLKKLKEPIYFLSIVGGVVTIFMGDYFTKSSFNFSDFEAVFAHTVLVVIPLGIMTIEHLKFNLKEVFKTVVIFAIIGIWCTFINCILGICGQESNYLYLVTNMLPNNLGGKYFALIYEGIFFTVLIITYFIRNKLEDIKKEIVYEKWKIILVIINVIVLSFTLIEMNQKFAIGKEHKEKIDILTVTSIYQIQNTIGNTQFDVEKQLERLFKNVTARETEIIEKDNTIEVLFEDNNKKIEISKSRLNLVESQKQLIIQKIFFKVVMLSQTIISFIDILVIVKIYIKGRKIKNEQ